ncbi:uncharacterized protein LOC141650377 [Silene latifolia]|uniref:uncharacterized protein LOC141650377 n=1 Tax=Silene latifolia TaxID=37657 RepID=UPI003D76AC34
MGIIKHRLVEKETGIKSISGNKVRGNLGDQWATCTNSSLHKEGHIWLFWDHNSYEVDILDVKTQSIHTKVLDKISGAVFWFTVVYGFNKSAERDPLWDSLRSYHRLLNGPWLVAGDFNCIMAIQDCHLADLGAKGAFFTWNNKHEYGSRVYSRLDRVFMNVDWMDMFFDSYAHFLPVAELSLNHFQQILVDDPLNEDLCHSEKECAKNFEELLKARDQFLRQKVKGDWMQHGDENIAYFHTSIKRRKARNRIY